MWILNWCNSYMNIPTFIETYKVSESLCDDLIKYYENNKEYTKLRKDIPNTNDSLFYNDSQDPTIQKFFKTLGDAITKYAKKYKIFGGLRTYVVNKIQHYQPGFGYSALHYERGRKEVQDRQVVYMLYLNTVKDEGGTIFPHQKVITKAIKGDLILWPADFTHPHAGIISKTEQKYIATGWFVMT